MGQNKNQLLNYSVYSVVDLKKILCCSGKARIRVQLSAGHTPQDVNRAVDAFITIGRRIKVIS